MVLALGPQRFALGQGGGGVVPTLNRLAANRLWTPTTTFSAADKVGCYRDHYASPEGDISDIVFHDVGWYINSAFDVTAGASSTTIWRFVEYPIGSGSFYQITWGGSVNGVLTGLGRISSDPLAVTMLASSGFRAFTINMSGATRAIVAQELPANSNTLGLTDGKFTYSGSGNPVAGAADASTTHFGATAITGTINKTGASGFVLFSDSTGFGTGDITSVGSKGSSGYFARGMADRFPLMKISRGGMTAAQAVSLIQDAAVQDLISVAGATDSMLFLGSNDLSQDSASVATITGNYTTILSSLPGLKGIQTVPPRTDSTDSWATVAGQTPKTDGNWAAEVDLNTAIRAGISGADYVMDTSDFACTGRNSRIWNADPAWVDDGVHSNSYGASQVALKVARDKLGRPAIIPSAVVGLTIPNTGSVAIPFYFALPATGTNPLTFLVEYKRTVDSVWTQFVTGSTALSGVITGLTASTSYDVRVTPSNDGGSGPPSVVSATTAATFQPIDIGMNLVEAFDAGNASKVTVDGSNNLVSFGGLYDRASLAPGGAAMAVVTNGGQTANKRVVNFAAGNFLNGVAAKAILDAPDGSTATSTITVVEAVKFVTGTSRSFLWGRAGTNLASFGERQTTTNRGASVVEVPSRAAVTALQAVVDTTNWHTLTTIKNGTSLIFRVDGVQVATGTLVGDGNWNFNDFYIGATPGSSAQGPGTPASVNPPAAYSGLAVVKAALSGADLTNMENWVKATAGL